MMQKTGAVRVFFAALAAPVMSLVMFVMDPSPVWAADRTTLFLPLSSTAPPSDPPPARFAADSSIGRADAGWQAYLRLWQAHHQDPGSAEIRRFFGLPLDGTLDFRAKRGRNAPSWLGWRPGSFAQIETPHFTIYSQADRTASQAVAEDLERCYWAWTQMFFPLWESRIQVTAALSGMTDDTPVQAFVSEQRPRISVGRKLKVILFAGPDQYAQTLGRDVPGIERSTGFYSDARKAICLYASTSDDAETRRHELVHQLFRESTRSALGRLGPGERSGFWLAEGIAGYFESMHVGQRLATVGGWDSPRLQFARYRVLVGSDFMPIAELGSDGRQAAQQRTDIARWYAHSIAQTHRLLDGGRDSDRVWVYRSLAQMYRIDADLDADLDAATGPGSDSPPPSDGGDAMRTFLTVGDADLIANPPARSLRSLCLAGCPVTAAGLASIPPSPELDWLDLSRVPVDTESVQRIAPEPSAIRQLTLEATKVDDSIGKWIAGAGRLRELDLSWTKVGDGVVASVAPTADLSVLWMTGTKITDQSVAKILGFKQLESVDVQRTGVTPAGIERLRTRQAVEVNPLELRTSP